PTSRPALTNEGTLGEIIQVLAARAPFYQEMADAMVETEGRSPDWVASALIDRWLPGRNAIAEE
ncbi:MAG TPA: hypothetical protein VKA15_09010, partial [Isosphaeraceae bacterium]|nr:hypothetical protein [Isosphaeraceae bacterium]